MRARLGGVDLVVAADVDHVLTGPEGAAAVFGPQKGADEETVARPRRGADDVGRRCSVRPRAPDLVDRPGRAPPAGWARRSRRSGPAGSPAGSWSARSRASTRPSPRADLVVTGEGRLDAQSLHGKLVSVVAARAREQGVPCIALAGQVDMSTGEALEAGLEGVYSVAADAGSVEAALAEPAARLADLAEGVAKRWGARPPG